MDGLGPSASTGARYGKRATFVQRDFWCGWMRVVGYEISCRCCGAYFRICRSCYRGHRYCSMGCRQQGRRQIHRLAQRRYATSDEGRESLRKQQKAYRIRRARGKSAQKTVSDPSSKDVCWSVKTVSAFCCSICGRQIHSITRGRRC